MNSNTAVDTAVWTPCYLVPHANVLMLEEVVGTDKARELAEKGADGDNPYLPPEVYRRMLREQYMVRARTRASMPRARMV